MNALGLEQAAQPADLDVDDPASSQVECLAGVLGRMDALVQADGRRELGLKPRVIDDVIVRQRLLDQQKIVGVKLLERGQIVECVCGIGIDLKRDRG